MVHADPVMPKACFHDELGYTRTFFQFQDTNISEQSDTSGVLVSKSDTKRINTTLAANVRLSRREDGSYDVSGRMAGKDVQAHLNGQLIGEVGLAARLREALLKGQSQALEATMWVPPADAAAPMKVVIRSRAEAGPGAATMEMGPMSMKLLLDAHGFPQRTEIPAGNATAVIERMSQTGEP